MATLDGIGRGRQRAIIQKREDLFQIGRGQRLQCLANRLEALDAGAQMGEFGQGHSGLATPIK
jgi:hypothetical protein